MMRGAHRPPVGVERYLDRADDRMVLRQITDEVMFEIRALSGQEYVDSYATKRSEDLPTETAVIGSRHDGDGHDGDGRGPDGADRSAAGGTGPGAPVPAGAGAASGETASGPI